MNCLEIKWKALKGFFRSKTEDFFLAKNLPSEGANFWKYGITFEKKKLARKKSTCWVKWHKSAEKKVKIDDQLLRKKKSKVPAEEWTLKFRLKRSSGSSKRGVKLSLFFLGRFDAETSRNRIKKFPSQSKWIRENSF